MLVDATSGPVAFDHVAIDMMEEMSVPYVVSLSSIFDFTCQNLVEVFF